MSLLDPAVAIPTFVGSLLSFLGTSIAIVLHIVYPPNRRPRHGLIFNLLFADCMNSFNNTISGAIGLAGKGPSADEPPDASCLANAWVGQFSVQTIDFTILIISIVVLHTVLNNQTPRPPSTRTTILVCASAWVPGLITSFIGLALNAYSEVSGNWCWISSERLGLRYALGHAWRIAIFITTIAIYTTVYILLKRNFDSFKITDPPISHKGTKARLEEDSRASDSCGIIRADLEEQELDERGMRSMWRDSMEGGIEQEGSSSAHRPPTQSQRASALVPTQRHSNASIAFHQPAPDLKRVLMLNGYPIAYVILWIPGIANRFVESVGTAPRWLSALQCSTQFIGLANALTYGYREHWRKASWKWIKGQSRA